jgi:hypothetical protein
MNTFKHNHIKTEASSAKKNQADETIKKATDFGFFMDKEKMGSMISPILMVVFVIILYVSLSHYHVKSIKKEDDLKKEIKELRSEYISVKSQLMKKSNQSEVSKRLTDEGIKELRVPPIIIEKKDQ